MILQNNRVQSPAAEIGNAFDRVSSLFQADTLAAQQFHETYRRKIPQQQEVRLMLAVLEDAINCYQDNLDSPNRKKIQLFKDAEEWFLSDDTGWIFSFVSVCSVLNLEPDYVRRGLKNWTQKQKPTRRDRRSAIVVTHRLVA